MYRGSLFIWPSLANILNLVDAVHTEIHPDLDQRRRKFLNQWKRLLTNLHVSQEPIVPNTRTLLYHFQEASYKALRIPWGVHGFWKVTDTLVHVVPKRYHEEDFGRSWIDMTIGEKIYGVHRLPAFRGFEQEVQGVQGEEFEGRGSARLSLFEKLGYLEKGSAIWEEVTFDPYSAPSYITFYLEMRYPFTYRWEVLKDFPFYSCQLC
jgi:hypothetical protein